MNGAPAPELRDIHLPPPPGFWPPALGWWILTLLILLLLLAFGRLLYRRYRHWHRRRVILQILEQICHPTGQDVNPARLAAELSTLLRRIALARFPQVMVAGLSGPEWLAFLDATGGNGRFSQGPGRVLLTAPYQAQTEFDQENLCTLVQEWVRRNA